MYICTLPRDSPHDHYTCKPQQCSFARHVGQAVMGKFMSVRGVWVFLTHLVCNVMSQWTERYEEKTLMQEPCDPWRISVMERGESTESFFNLFVSSLTSPWIRRYEEKVTFDFRVRCDIKGGSYIFSFKREGGTQTFSHELSVTEDYEKNDTYMNQHYKFFYSLQFS